MFYCIREPKESVRGDYLNVIHFSSFFLIKLNRQKVPLLLENAMQPRFASAEPLVIASRIPDGISA